MRVHTPGRQTFSLGLRLESSGQQHVVKDAGELFEELVLSFVQQVH